MVFNSNTLDFLWLQDGEQGVPGDDGSSLYTWVKYSQTSDGYNMTDNPTNAVYIGIAYNKTSSTESSDPLDYNWSKIKGDDGDDGEDAYTIILTNENISFSTDKTNLPLTNQSVTCGIVIYKGTSPVTSFTVGTITAPTGIGVTQSNASITVSVSNSVYVPNDSGQIQIPITIGSVTVNKQISYSLSKQGDDGRGIASTTIHYIASSNGVTPPLVNDNWQTTIPTVSPSEYLWTRTTITYTDGTVIRSYSVGKDGKGIALVTNEYKISSSNQNPDAGRSDGTTSTWSIIRPTDIETDEYLWIRYKYTYDDGSYTYSSAIYDSTIDGISSILDTENRTIKDTVWETAYFTVVDETTGQTTQMNIKNTIVQNTTDISGIESRVEVTEENLGDFTNSEYTLFKQSVSSFQTQVTNNLNNTTTIATQTAEDFSWLFLKTTYDAYLVDEHGNYVVDKDGNYVKAENESGDTKIMFTQQGINMVNGVIEIKAPNGETTIVEGGRINTNNIASVDGTSWINLGLGIFNYNNKLVWDGITLTVDGTIYANAGRISSDVIVGDADGYHIKVNQNSFDVYEDSITTLASFGATSIIGDTDEYHVKIDNDSFDVLYNNKLLATFSGDRIALDPREDPEMPMSRTAHIYMSRTDMRFGNLVIGYGYKRDEFTGDGSTKTFLLTSIPASIDSQDVRVTIDNVLVTSGYNVTNIFSNITFDSPPANGAEIVVVYSDANKEYVAVGGHYDPNFAGKDSLSIGLSGTYGSYSIAQGYHTQAFGDYSSAFGYYSTASHDNEFVIGKYNDSSSSTSYAFVIGNGTDELENNAFTVDWNGNVNIDGNVNVTGNIIGNVVSTNTSHVGMIIQSTTLDTMAKVIAIYGGTTWIQHSGYFLYGATSGVTSNSAQSDGGESTVTLTGAQSGVAAHGHGFTQPTITVNTRYAKTAGDGSARYHVASSGDLSTTFVTATASGGSVANAAEANASQAHNNMPPYKNVYVWERTA